MWTSPRFPRELTFGSFLIYPSPANTQPERNAKNFILTLKNERRLAEGTFSSIVAHRIAANVHGSPLSELFDGTATLIPLPGSAPLLKDALWPALAIAKALADVGLAAGVVPCLQRSTYIRKSAWCAKEGRDRPTPLEHYASMRVEPHVLPAEEIVLIDDVITKGATMVGGAARLAELFPGSRIRAFAVARTVEPPMDAWVDPIVGTVLGDEDGRRSRRLDRPTLF
jgi:hypothetical protein